MEFMGDKFDYYKTVNFLEKKIVEEDVELNWQETTGRFLLNQLIQ